MCPRTVPTSRTAMDGSAFADPLDPVAWMAHLRVWVRGQDSRRSRHRRRCARCARIGVSRLALLCAHSTGPKTSRPVDVSTETRPGACGSTATNRRPRTRLELTGTGNPSPRRAHDAFALAQLPPERCPEDERRLERQVRASPLPARRPPPACDPALERRRAVLGPMVSPRSLQDPALRGTGPCPLLRPVRQLVVGTRWAWWGLKGPVRIPGESGSCLIQPWPSWCTEGGVGRELQSARLPKIAPVSDSAAPDIPSTRTGTRTLIKAQAPRTPLGAGIDLVTPTSSRTVRDAARAVRWE